MKSLSCLWIILFFALTGALTAFAAPKPHPIPKTGASKSQVQTALSQHLSKTGSPATLVDLANSGIPIDTTTLQVAGVPEVAHRFFEPHTGRFNYYTKVPAPLALENGDQPIDAIRIAYGGFMDPNFEHLLADFGPVLRAIPSMRLLVSAHFLDVIHLRRLIKKHLSVFQSRIEIAVTLRSRPDEWTQDRSKPLENGRQTLASHDKDFPRIGTQPDWASIGRAYTSREALKAHRARDQLEIHETVFRLEFGNVIVGAKHVFVGRDSISALTREFRISEQDALRALTIEFGKPVLPIPQSAFHIDLAMAIARDRSVTFGQEVIFISSMVSLLKAVGTHLGENLDNWDDSSHVDAFLKKVQSRAQALQPTPENRPEHALLAQLGTYKSKDVKEAIQREEELERLLKALGYQVHRVPGFQRALFTQKFPHYFNYTNAIFSRDIAIVPGLRIPFLDSMAEDAFKEFGYSVILMPSSLEMFTRAGGVRCRSETFRMQQNL